MAQGDPSAAKHLNVYAAIAANRRRTMLMLGLFIGLVAALGYLLGELLIRGSGVFLLPVAFALSAGAAAGSYFGGDALVLRMSQAREVTATEEPVLHHVVEALAIGAGVPKPRLFVIEDGAPNAFATGRDPQHASIAVTRGLLEKMNRTELEGVLAHELSHVRNYDIRVMLIIAVLLGMTALLSDWILRATWWGGGRDRDRGGNAAVFLLVLAIVLAVLTPVVAQLIQLAVSRQREYLADASGALLTRYPPGLAGALRKIAADKEALEVANKATASLYIANPLHDDPKLGDRLFDTHPPIAERIKRLEAM
jgi:heat shock protein HtpX